MESEEEIRSSSSGSSRDLRAPASEVAAKALNTARDLYTSNSACSSAHREAGDAVSGEPGACKSSRTSSHRASLYPRRSRSWRRMGQDCTPMRDPDGGMLSVVESLP